MTEAQSEEIMSTDWQVGAMSKVEHLEVMKRASLIR